MEFGFDAIDMKYMGISHWFVILATVSWSCAGAQIQLPQTYQAARFEDSQQYAVTLGQYPAFRMPQLFQPPAYLLSERRPDLNAVPPIQADDIWQVRFKVQEALLIYSETYQTRYCELLSRVPTSGYRFRDGRCVAWLYSIHVWIDASGKVMGGWFRMKNVKPLLLSDDRKEKFFLNPENAKGWIGFEPLR